MSVGSPGSPESPAPAYLDLYESVGRDSTLDLSRQELTTIPEIVNPENICMLYLQNNGIKDIPDDFFPSLSNLMWLDLRDNSIYSIPVTIRFHPNLSHLLLQNNKITSLPDELGTLTNLKTLQLGGNPLFYPPKNVLNSGIGDILTYLNTKFEDKIMAKCDVISEGSENVSAIESPNTYTSSCYSCDSTTDAKRQKSKKLGNIKTPLSVQVSDKEIELGAVRTAYAKREGKCPKLAKARYLPSHSQSKKYLKPLKAACKDEQTVKMRQCYLREMAQAKYRELVAQREKIIQDRKNLNHLKDWRNNYQKNQMIQSQFGASYSLDRNNLPYDTHPDYMVLLSREDLEKDLPDKYKKRLVRKSRPSVPRRSGDRQLANKIKELFENLERINLNRDALTPRTEQKMLLNEIEKITEIRQKLSELSTTNIKTITA